MNRPRNPILLAGGLTALLVLLWLLFSPWGAVSLFRLQSQLTELQGGNKQLAAANQALTEEINRLKNDPAHLEKVAREEYGLLKKNEVLYQPPPKKSAKH